MKSNNKLLIRILLSLLILFPNILIYCQNINTVNTGENYKYSNWKQNFAGKYYLGNRIITDRIMRVRDFDEDDEEDQGGLIIAAFIVALALVILASPYYIPASILEEDYPDKYYYQNYPFEDSNGFLDEVGREWMANLSFSTHYIDEDITDYQINTSFRYCRLALEPSYLNYNLGKEEKDIKCFDSMLLFTFAQNNFINFRSGFGYTHFETDSKHDGIDYKYQVELFSKPLHLDLEYKLTGYNFKKGEKVAYNNDFAIFFGYFYKRLELNLGYSWNEIGDTYLKGPGIHTVFWF
ncbi:MAG: hypothetical protein RAO94_00870 [Candidatus Stygibacter australis]|nr:hypothetical protein [Candidatus Stygibacter australis]MDP8320880.1 hypothetical protein [Candidatus Stygibacter australis]